MRIMRHTSRRPATDEPSFVFMAEVHLNVPATCVMFTLGLCRRISSAFDGR